MGSRECAEQFKGRPSVVDLSLSMVDSIAVRRGSDSTETPSLARIFRDAHQRSFILVIAYCVEGSLTL